MVRSQRKVMCPGVTLSISLSILISFSLILKIIGNSNIARSSGAFLNSNFVTLGAKKSVTVTSLRKLVCKLQIKESMDSELPDVASFFAQEFFGADGLKKGQVQTLERDQLVDFRKRYGKVTKRQFETSLLVAKDKEGALLGCIGVEVVPCTEQKLGVKAPLGPKTKGVMYRPVMSNLVVARSARKRGLGKKLVAEAESQTKSWGYTEMLLLVDKENKPARNLYSKLGYSVLFEDDSATKIIQNEFKIMTVPSTNICMRRNITKSPSIFEGLFRIFKP